MSLPRKRRPSSRSLVFPFAVLLALLGAALLVAQDLVSGLPERPEDRSMFLVIPVDPTAGTGDADGWHRIDDGAFGPLSSPVPLLGIQGEPGEGFGGVVLRENPDGGFSWKIEGDGSGVNELHVFALESGSWNFEGKAWQAGVLGSGEALPGGLPEEAAVIIQAREDGSRGYLVAEAGELVLGDGSRLVAGTDRGAGEALFSGEGNPLSTLALLSPDADAPEEASTAGSEDAAPQSSQLAEPEPVMPPEVFSFEGAGFGDGAVDEWHSVWLETKGKNKKQKRKNKRKAKWEEGRMKFGWFNQEEAALGGWSTVAGGYVNLVKNNALGGTGVDVWGTWHGDRGLRREFTTVPGKTYVLSFRGKARKHGAELLVAKGGLEVSEGGVSLPEGSEWIGTVQLAGAVGTHAVVFVADAESTELVFWPSDGEGSPAAVVDSSEKPGIVGGLIDDIMLSPMVIRWEAEEGSDNLSLNIDPFSEEENGLRIFPGWNAPGGDWQREVGVVVEIPGLSGWTVHVKVLDVDDPTPHAFDPSHIVDPNDAGGNAAGDDNMKGVKLLADWGHFYPEEGTFPPSPVRQRTAVLDSEGRGRLTFHSGQQPGNNYRVAVALKEEELNFLQVSDSAKEGYVPPASGRVDGFQGAASKMLTVWRKLHIEADSMEAPPELMPAPDCVKVEGTHWTRKGLAGPIHVLHLKDEVPGDDEFYWGGFIRSDTHEYRILSTSGKTISIASVVNPDHEITAAGKATFVGEFVLCDDDGDGVKQLLPEKNLVGEELAKLYAPAWIEVVPIDPELNPRDSIPFEANTGLGLLGGAATSLYDSRDNKHADTIGYWYQYVIAAYQPAPYPFMPSNDDDPNGEPALPGSTPVVANPYCAVFVETLREYIDVATWDPRFEQEYRKKLILAVAHEVGHVPDRIEGHPETGLMSEGAEQGNTFAPESLLRFRKTPSWDDPW